jgi:hypothetical protein
MRSSVFQSTDKADNPLIATQASPGMGKSALIDALNSLSLEQISHMSPSDSTAEFHRAMSCSIRVTIDYNGYQSIIDEDLTHPVATLGLRILHSYVSHNLEVRISFH